MSLLWELEKDNINIKELIKNSTHRVTDKRISWLSAWVNDSKILEKFIEINIDSPCFYPFADPWNGEIEKIFNVDKQKIIRLSSRKPGYLTLSNNKGIDNSFRFVVNEKGIENGYFIFKTISELISHLTETECCICLEFVKEEDNTSLECGHIFHTKCLKENEHFSNKCPFCKISARKSISLPSDDFSNYSIRY